MYRAPLIAAGTVIGAAGVLAFPVHSTQVSAAIPAAAGSAAPASSTTGTAVTAGAAPSAAATPSPTSAPTPAATSATGADEAFRFGDIAVSVTVTGGRITNVTVAGLHEADGRSASIDSYALPLLQQQVITANSANIQGVSGATFTSRAFAQSVASALSKLGFQG